jgi:hypothetical protein
LAASGQGQGQQSGEQDGMFHLLFPYKNWFFEI